MGLLSRESLVRTAIGANGALDTSNEPVGHAALLLSGAAAERTRQATTGATPLLLAHCSSQAIGSQRALRFS